MHPTLILIVRNLGHIDFINMINRFSVKPLSLCGPLLSDVASFKKNPDLVISNCDILSVYTDMIIYVFQINVKCLLKNNRFFLFFYKFLSCDGYLVFCPETPSASGVESFTFIKFLWSGGCEVFKVDDIVKVIGRYQPHQIQLKVAVGNTVTSLSIQPKGIVGTLPSWFSFKGPAKRAKGMTP